MSCSTGKKAYETHGAAERARKALRKKRKTDLHTYHCDECKAFHLGRDHKEATSREHLKKARELMQRQRGYGDRKGRKANVDRLLWKNFGQGSAPKNPKAYREGHERIFGDKRPPVEPGQRDGYVVRFYKPDMAHEIDLDLPQNMPDAEDA